MLSFIFMSHSATECPDLGIIDELLKKNSFRIAQCNLLVKLLKTITFEKNVTKMVKNGQ